MVLSFRDMMNQTVLQKKQKKIKFPQALLYKGFSSNLKAKIKKKGKFFRKRGLTFLGGRYTLVNARLRGERPETTPRT